MLKLSIHLVEIDGEVSINTRNFQKLKFESSDRLRFSLIMDNQESTIEKRNFFFNPPVRPITLSATEFKARWDHCDDWWNKLRGVNTDGWHTFGCKFNATYERSQKRFTATNEDVALMNSEELSNFSEQSHKRLRISSKGVACPAKIKFKILDDGNYCVASIGSYAVHCHPIDSKLNPRLPSKGKDMLKEVVEAHVLFKAKDIKCRLPQLLEDPASPNKLKVLKLDMINSQTVGNLRRASNQFSVENRPRVVDEDVIAALRTIRETGIWCEHIDIPSQGAQLIAFASDFGLRYISNNQYLVMMDSTHCTNVWKWRLTTIYVRTKDCVWIVGAQLYISKENAHVLTIGLQSIKEKIRLTYNDIDWRPQYWLIDRSMTERRAIMTVFDNSPGTILYCTVHSLANLMKNVKCNQLVFNAMRKAIFSRSIEEMNEEIEKAISAASERIKNYLEFNWLRPGSTDRESWSMAYRNHSPALIQCSSTNPLESYHGDIKNSGKLNRQCTLSVAVQEIISINIKKEFWAKKASACVGDHYNAQLSRKCSGFQGLPIVIQDLLWTEVKSASDRIKDGKRVWETESGLEFSCVCEFFVKYMLPCKHIFQRHFLAVNILTSAVVEGMVAPIEAQGMGFYEAPSRESVAVERDIRIESFRQRSLRMKSMHEFHMQFYYEMESRGLSDEYINAYITTYESKLEELMNATRFMNLST